MILLRARTLLPVSSLPLEDGAVLVHDGCIQAFGPHATLARLPHTESIDLGGVVLMPGLINAHCHLDFTMLRKSILSKGGFTKWIRRINSMKSRFSDEDYLASIQSGFEQLAATGTTSVFNIISFPGLLARIPPSPVRTWWFLEMMDIRPGLSEDPESVCAAARPHAELLGLSPHAPYTASVPLFQRAAEYSRLSGLPFTTHLCESSEELTLFQRGEGPLKELLASIGPLSEHFGKGSALRCLLEHNALPAGAILAHMNTLSDEDIALLACHPLARTFHVVHCPGSHAFFEHPPFRMDALMNIGIPVSLGTDSLASTDTLDLFVEMRRVRNHWPHLPARTILEMATRNPAAAVGRGNTLGCIAPGAAADLIAIVFEGNAADAEEFLVTTPTRVGWRMFNGEIHR